MKSAATAISRIPVSAPAGRMQVPRPELQHAVMIEAVENHMPEVIVIDEIGTEAEAQAARTIAERGVQLIATAHGRTLDNLLMNPTLSDLLGGIHAVTLSDEEARRRGTQKTVLERKAPPTFDTLVEIRNRDEFSVYHETASVVDAFLRGRSTRPEVRVRKEDGYEVVERSGRSSRRRRTGVGSDGRTRGSATTGPRLRLPAAAGRPFASILTASAKTGSCAPSTICRCPRRLRRRRRMRMSC